MPRRVHLLQHALFGPAYRAGDAASDGRETSRRAVYRVGWGYLGTSAVKRPASEAFPVINPYIWILFAGGEGRAEKASWMLPNAARCLRPGCMPGVFATGKGGGRKAR